MFCSKFHQLLLLVSFFAYLCVFQGCGQKRVSYTQFSGEVSSLSILESRNIVLLYPAKLYDADSLSLLLQVYDKAYDIAVGISEREPANPDNEMEKLTLAVVRNTCGSGCGRLGKKGIEITRSKFTKIYQEFVNNGNHDHLFFYELGRNFWFYGETLPETDLQQIHTGFAIFFRDFLVAELAIEVAPINGSVYKQYMSEKEAKWNALKIDNENLILEDIVSVYRSQYSQESLIWSSLWWEIYTDTGREGVRSAIEGVKSNPLSMMGESWYAYLSCFH